jgi:hypothetical protein
MRNRASTCAVAGAGDLRLATPATFLQLVALTVVSGRLPLSRGKRHFCFSRNAAAAWHAYRDETIVWSLLVGRAQSNPKLDLSRVQT